MQLEWLEDFVELARTRSFSRAAENRFVTHPAFGRRIRALEEWIGAKLVERKQPVALTLAGLSFLETATHMIGVLQAARVQLNSVGLVAKNTLTIATGRTLATTFFPDWYENITRRFGAFPVSVCTSGAQEAIVRLSAGDADLLLGFSSPTTRLLVDPLRFESLVLAQESMVPVSVPNDYGNPRFFLSDKSVDPIPWLAFSPTLSLRSALAEHLGKMAKKLPLHMVYQADSYEAILEMAKRGTGVAWLPRAVVNSALQSNVLVIAGTSEMFVDFDISLYRLRSNTKAQVVAIWNGLVLSNQASAEK